MIDPKATAMPAPFLGTLVGLGLSGVVPLLLSTVGRPSVPYADILLLAVVFVVGLRFAWIVASRNRHLYEMTLWLFAYLFLGVAPVLQLRTSLPGTTPNLVLDLALPAAGIVLVGCIAIIIGSMLGARRPSAAPVKVTGQVNAQATYLWTSACLALSAVYVVRVGPQNLFAARNDLKDSWASNLGYDLQGLLVSSGSRIGLMIAFVALMMLCRQRQAEGGPRPILLTAVVLLALVSIVNPISSARYTFGTAALAILAAFGAYATLRRFRIVALSALAGLVVVFPVLSTFRNSLDSTVSLESPLQSMTTGDFDSFAQIINSVEFTESLGYTWGRQLLGAVLFWVPRNLWPGKPTDTGIVLGEFKQYRFTNLSAPAWAEAFINFGWVGVVVLLAALGFVLRRADARAEATLRLTPIPGVLASVAPFYMLIILRGSLLQAMSGLLVIVVGAWFVSRQPRPKKTPSRRRYRQPVRA